MKLEVKADTAREGKQAMRTRFFPYRRG